MTEREQAEEMVRLAWSDCDAAGEMREWSRWSGRRDDQKAIAANLIDEAEQMCQDKTGEQVSLAAMLRARSLLIDEADAWLARDAEVGAP